MSICEAARDRLADEKPDVLPCQEHIQGAAVLQHAVTLAQGLKYQEFIIKRVIMVPFAKGRHCGDNFSVLNREPVLVRDIEGRIGNDQINGLVSESLHAFDCVHAVDAAVLQHVPTVRRSSADSGNRPPLRCVDPLARAKRSSAILT
jgi:hypothetical protein